MNFYKYSETNVMHFLIKFIKISDLYIFRALLAHPQETLHKRHLVYCVRACYVNLLHQGWSSTKYRLCSSS
jgi:hypothetical protein